jgi:hypothetical protein
MAPRRYPCVEEEPVRLSGQRDGASEMSCPTHNTTWATSSKGNLWKRTNGVVCVVGQRKDGGYWARRGDDFVSGSFSTLSEAKRAAETGQSGQTLQRFDYESW